MALWPRNDSNQWAKKGAETVLSTTAQPSGTAGPRSDSNRIYSHFVALAPVYTLLQDMHYITGNYLL